MSRQDLENEIALLIESITGKEIVPDLYEEHFFSNSFKLTPFYLVYIFFSVQEKFGVKFSKEEITKMELTSVSKIAGLVWKRKKGWIADEVNS